MVFVAAGAILGPGGLDVLPFSLGNETVLTISEASPLAARYGASIATAGEIPEKAPGRRAADPVSLAYDRGA